MVPIYALSSWISLVSLTASQFVDPIRDMYEAFTIYTFFQLLINFLGGERSLIIMMHGRAPKEHVWPLNLVFPKVDISDPHTFLAIKRGILQYAWLKPPLALAAIIMKATGTYQEGYVGLRSGYFWSGIIYNISVTISLYSLGIFWLCMSRDLTPFRPVPKFLCIKLIIFFSYWQGFLLSLLVWLGIIPDVPHYTPDNIARAIQDVLICFELPGFAIAHWYAFSWRDYADDTISAARMPINHAFRDSFGIRDLIEDSKLTFRGKSYQYRLFDPSETVMSHPESTAGVARMLDGLRYERGGKGKYWIPQPTSGTATPSSRTSLLNSQPGPSNQSRVPRGENATYGAMNEPDENSEDERLFASARALEHGDYNYPVIAVNRPYYAHSRSYRRRPTPEVITTATNQAILNPPSSPVARQVKKKGRKHKATSPGEDEQAQPLLGSPTSPRSTGSHHKHSGDSTPRHEGEDGLVDLVVEDKTAEERERVRARKEGGPEGNKEDPKVLVKNWPPEEAGEIVDQEVDNDPTGKGKKDQPLLESDEDEGLDRQEGQFTLGDEEDGWDDDGSSGGSGGGGKKIDEVMRMPPPPVREEESPWGQRDGADEEEPDLERGTRAGGSGKKTVFGSFADERDVWGR